MKSITKETFELDSVESKVFDEFQSILFSMRDCAVKKETQSTIESVYASINSLIYPQ